MEGGVWVWSLMDPSTDKVHAARDLRALKVARDLKWLQ